MKEHLMRRPRTLRVTALAAVATGAVGTLAYAMPTNSVHVDFEQNVSSTGDWHAGEPGIAVNPKDQDNVVAVWPEQDATGVYRNPATGTYDTLTGTIIGYANDPAASRCGLAISHDAGRTWRRTVLPAQTVQSSLCSDATIAAGPDGTFYAAVITFAQPTTPLPGITPETLPHLTNVDPGRGSADVVIRSIDGGRTWSSPPVDAIGNRTAADRARFAPGSNPALGGEGTCDRPWITVDQQSNTVYVVGTADAIQFNGSTKNETWVTASHDGARSFGTVYPVDSPEYPQSGGASIAAGHGVLAVAYSGHRAGQSADGVVFETSRNGGKTFHRRTFAAPTSASAPFGVYLAGDPAHAGHYAVAVPGDGDNLLIYATRNSGASWSHTQVAVGTDRPWVAFSPDGTLGVMGRVATADGGQDIRAAFSFDGGEHLTKPLQVNKKPAPPLNPGTLALYDDLSWITLGKDYAYIGWGDTRTGPSNENGESNIWIARLRVH
jgi:hypothetical protein